MWTQVYIKGLAETVDPTDEQLEELLDARFKLSNLPELTWAGPGSTIVKRSDEGVCRGYGFVCFMTAAGAAKVVDKMNEYAANPPDTITSTTTAAVQKEEQEASEDDIVTNPQEHIQEPDDIAAAMNAVTITDDNCDASLQQQQQDVPQSLLLPHVIYAEISKPKGKSTKKKKKVPQQDYSDLRVRRQRAAPVRKHPVIVNSNGTKTGLGNKTR